MLDRRRPLFEIHLIDGLESGQFALYVKSHHVSWDGRSAMARIFGSLSRNRAPSSPAFTRRRHTGQPGDETGMAHNLRALLGQAMAMRELYADGIASESAHCAANRAVRAATRLLRGPTRDSISR